MPVRMQLVNMVFLNGSLRGRLGNTARIIDHLTHYAAARAQVVQLTLADLQTSQSAIEQQLKKADAFLVCSGVYWNSHGSPMQRFLEFVTHREATDTFLGKPAGVVLSMDSVGGMEVAARLASVLNLFGCTIPPLGAVVVSRVGQIANAASQQQDVYSRSDAELLMDNLIIAARAPKPAWRCWPVKPTRRVDAPYASLGVLDIDHPPWLNE